MEASIIEKNEQYSANNKQEIIQKEMQRIIQQGLSEIGKALANRFIF
jgi:hypothetical protein